MSITEQFILCFIFGGFVCVIAQLLIDLTKLTPARILVLLVIGGVILYGTGLYNPIFEIFGAGVSVPLLGFGAVIAKGVKTAVDSDGMIGILTGGLTASSAGITSALIFGFSASVLFKTKSKKM